MNPTSPTPGVNYQTAAERAKLARPRVTEAEIEAGAPAECVGCGTTKSLAQIRRDAPQAMSCCPERAMRAPGSTLDLAALIQEVDELPNPERSLLSHNERVLIEFCHRLALPLRAMNSRRVQVDYTNHEGVRGLRTITPLGVYFGTFQPYHPEPQWLIPCVDHDRDAVRVYAQASVHAWDGVSIGQEDAVNEAAARIFARLCEFDDRTSPAEYPDMVLVTAEELSALMTEELTRQPDSAGQGEAQVWKLTGKCRGTPSGRGIQGLCEMEWFRASDGSRHSYPLGFNPNTGRYEGLVINNASLCEGEAQTQGEGRAP